MLNQFVKGQINDSTICIKIDGAILPKLFDVLHDAGYTVTKSTPEEWDYNIYNGDSYELDTIEELEVFEENNEKAKTIRNAKA